MSKVNSVDNDNCKMEFEYAVGHRGAKNIIPVVMEPEMRFDMLFFLDIRGDSDQSIDWIDRYYH